MGEDGPTHQPIETAASLRMIHNLTVIRPSDANEVKEAWIGALQNQIGPTALLDTKALADQIARFIRSSGLHQGAYTLWQSGRHTELLLIATGSEVELALNAAKLGKNR